MNNYEKLINAKYGYRLEVSLEHDDMLELVKYENNRRFKIDEIAAAEVNSYKDAWKFIERQIGSSTKCDFSMEAVSKIFG